MAFTLSGRGAWPLLQENFATPSNQFRLTHSMANLIEGKRRADVTAQYSAADEPGDFAEEQKVCRR
jgi:hypothetical protein